MTMVCMFDINEARREISRRAVIILGDFIHFRPLSANVKGYLIVLDVPLRLKVHFIMV